MSGRLADEQREQAWQVAEDIARRLNHRQATVSATLAAIGQAATAHVAAASEVGIILLVQGKLVPQYTTGTAPHVLDLVQQKLDDGPCIEAARLRQVVVIEKMGDEHRWTTFATEALSLGVESMLCVPLWVQDRLVGTLSIYSDRPGNFSPHDVALTRLFAAQTAIALLNAQRGQQFEEAVASRDVIGQAKGILVERRRLTSDDAFQCLSLASQAANIKLVEVARRLVETGELIGIDVPI